MVLPGFICFFSNVPGPCDEVLAEIWHYGVRTHHLRAEHITEDTLVVVEVDGQQFPLKEHIYKHLGMGKKFINIMVQLKIHHNDCGSLII